MKWGGSTPPPNNANPCIFIASTRSRHLSDFTPHTSENLAVQYNHCLLEHSNAKHQVTSFN